MGEIRVLAASQYCGSSVFGYYPAKMTVQPYCDKCMEIGSVFFSTGVGKNYPDF